MVRYGAFFSFSVGSSNIKEKGYEALLIWFKEKFRNKVNDVKISDGLQTSMGLHVSQWDYDKNVDASQKSGDTTMEHHLNAMKILEINTYHPLIEDLLCRIKDSKDDETTFVWYESFLNETI
jgi:HSP90 family molecular chaperone